MDRAKSDNKDTLGHSEKAVNGQDKRLNLSEDPAFPDFYLYKSVGNGGYHITIIPFAKS